MKVSDFIKELNCKRFVYSSASEEAKKKWLELLFSAINGKVSVYRASKLMGVKI